MARVLAHLSALVLGLLAGAMLFIGVVLVPSWQALPPAEFRVWFAANAPGIGRLMFPLGGAAALSAIAAWLAGRSARDGRAVWLGLAAAAAVGVGVVTVLVNEPANERFAAPNGLSDPETTALLAHWVRWHYMRVGLGLVGFGARYGQSAAAPGDGARSEGCERGEAPQGSRPSRVKSRKAPSAVPRDRPMARRLPDGARPPTARTRSRAPHPRSR